MAFDDRFDDLLASLGGFYRAWVIHLGLDLGLFEAVRAAGPGGMSVAELAEATGTHTEAVEAWSWAADAHDLLTYEDGRLVGQPAVAEILLDADRADYLGGQFIHAVTASMDWGAMPDFFRTGRPLAERPDRYRMAIERLTRQDIAVFFQEALAALPQLVADLSRGGKVVDVHCGGGRWLVAMARRFPELQLIGVESEPDSVARARATIAAEGLTERIEIRQMSATSKAKDAISTSPTSSTRCTSWPTRCRPCGSPTRRSGRVAASSSWTGRCRTAWRSRGPAMASSSPVSSSTSSSRAPPSPPASATSAGSPRPGWRPRPRSICRRGRRCSWRSAAATPGSRPASRRRARRPR